MSDGDITFTVVGHPNVAGSERIRALATTSRGQYDEHFAGDLRITDLVALIRTRPTAWAALREAVMPDIPA